MEAEQNLSNFIIKIKSNNYIFDIIECDTSANKDDPSLASKKKNNQRRKLTILMDCVYVHYLISELLTSSYYRACFLLNFNELHQITLILKPTDLDLIDYNWNSRIDYMVREKCELNYALSWLSTLGGAFSALGDYFANCAEVAGKISYQQLKLALRMNDQNTVARCRLYFSLSLIQKKYFKIAQRIIYNEYQTAKCAVVIDNRLLKMCEGIWSKLKYEHQLHRKNKKQR